MASTLKKSRSFTNKWLTVYPWLIYAKDLNSMKCSHCVSERKNNHDYKYHKSFSLNLEFTANIQCLIYTANVDF